MEFYNILQNFVNFYRILQTITEFYKILNQIDAIADVIKIRVTHKTGGQYSTTAYDLLAHKSSDGRVLHIPMDSILELKFPSTDIQGTII